MWQRFTERARRVVFFAQEEAGRRGLSDVDTEHLLLGILRDDDNVAMRVLASLAIDVESLGADVRQRAPTGDKLERMDMQLTSASKNAIDLAYNEAQRLNNNYIGTEHLLLGLLREERGIAAQQLGSHGVELVALRVSAAALQEASAMEAARRAALALAAENVEPRELVDRLSDSAINVIRFAQEEARRLSESYFSTEHLLLGLLRDNSDRPMEMLRRLGVTTEAVESELMRQVSRGDGSGPAKPEPTPRVKRVFDMARRIADPFGDALIGPEHLLMGLINEREGLAGRVLLSLGVNSNNAMNAFRAARSGEPEILSESMTVTSLEIQLEALRQRLEKLPSAPVAPPTRAEPEILVPSPLFGDLGIARPTMDRTKIEVAHDAAAFRKLLAVFLAKDAYGYRSLTDGDQTVFLLPADTRLKLLVPPTDCEDLFEEGYHVRVLEGDYAGYAGWIVKAAFQRTGFDAAEFPPRS